MTTMNNDLWNASLYDNNHAFVSNYGADVVTLLNPKKGEKVLDIGCGTGDLANTLHELELQVIGVDYSKNMVQQAQQKYPHIPFVVADATQLQYDNEFDCVFSNATLHWIKEPEKAVKSIYASLKQGGRMVVEFGGAGNVETITTELIHQIQQAGIPFTDEQFPWYFPTIGQYTSLLESYGFHVSYALHFSRPTKLSGEGGLHNWLNMFSPSIFTNVDDAVKQRIFDNVSTNLREKLHYDGSWHADYKRLRIVAVKK